MPHFEHVEQAYAEAGRIDALGVSYDLGGGHYNTTDRGQITVAPGTPSDGNVQGGPEGFDCSGAVSGVLYAAGLLRPSPTSAQWSYALNTEALEHWGEGGPGKYLTVYVIDETSPLLHHCIARFTGRPGVWAHEFFAAQHAGTKVGWFTAAQIGPLSAYHQRHWPGT